MRDHRGLIHRQMNRLIVFLFIIVLVVNCTPKLGTKGDTGEYVEDVSAYRPTIEEDESAVTEDEDTTVPKGPYVAPTHSINAEMSTIMDSIVYHNRDKAYYTYTIQVYTGRHREEANQSREQVYRLLPEEKPELVYRQPSYKVNVGRFFDRVEAYKTLMKLREVFPSATLVMEQNYMK